MSNERVWLKFDIGFFQDFSIMDLRDRFGATGPLVFIALMVAAKTTEWVHGAGNVVLSYSALAAEVGSDKDTVRQVVDALGEYCLVDLTEISSVGFHAHLLRWDDHQSPTRPKSGAERTAEYRERRQAGNPQTPDSPSPDLTNHVTERVTPTSHCDVRRENGEERTELPDGSSETARTRNKINQNELPNGFPPELEPTVQPVLDILLEVHSARGGNAPTRRGVGLVLADYPRRDHLDCARKLRHWATAGRGLRAKRKDWAATYRTFVEGSDDTAAPAALSPADLGDKLLAEALAGRRVA